VLANSDGIVHALRADGSELAGWPVQVRPLPGFGPADVPNYRGSATYASGAIVPDEQRSAVMASPAVADLTGDGDLEVVVATEDGEVYVWSADGSLEPGFPTACDPALSPPEDREHQIDIGFFASPVLADLLGDGDLEIVAAAYDGYLYAWNPDASPVDGFPVRISDPGVTDEPQEQTRIMTTPAVADFDEDGILDVAVGSNEAYGSEFDGRFYLVHGDGNRHAGGPSPPPPRWPTSTTTASWTSPPSATAAPRCGSSRDGSPPALPAKRRRRPGSSTPSPSAG
jgi:hypothetical protein